MKAKRIFRNGVGLEIEVENAPPIDLAGWKREEDNSLRNHGIEFITQYGVRIFELCDILHQFCFYVQKYKQDHPQSFEFSERTSVHVHLDCRKMSIAEAKNLVMIYTIFEDSLFKFAGAQRQHNVFCVPLRYVNLSTLPRHSFSTFVRSWKKYSAINLLRLHDFGTIEFRHMEGNANYERILTWVFLLASMLDYARMTDPQELMEDIKKLKYLSHYMDFSTQVFGPLSEYLLLDPYETDLAVSDAKQLFSLSTEA